MSVNKTVGKHIRSLRKTRNITQEQLIELIGDENISLSTLKRTENGNGGFNIEKLVLICKALNCELVDLFDEKQINNVFILSASPSRYPSRSHRRE